MTFPEYVPIDRAFAWHISQRLGAPVTRVRTVDDEGDDRVVEMELHGEVPDGTTRWVPVVEVTDAGVAAWKADRDAVPASRPPWERPGWWDGAIAWTEEQLAGLGHSRTGEIQQLKHWSISAVLLVPTDRGGLVLKEVPALFGAEGRLLEVLDRLLPGSVPRPVAIDDANHRWLMERFDEPADDEHTRAPDGALGRLVEIQRVTIGRREEVVGAGCPDRGLAQLERDLATLAERADLLGSELADRLRAALPDLQRRSVAVHDLGLPDTVVHGDFHQWNSVVRADGSIIVFDWTDAAWGHPFLDLAAWQGRSKDPAASAEAYLAGWTADVAIEDLRRGWAEAEPLSYLHYAIDYQRIIDATDDPSWSPELGRLVERALSVASGDG